MSWTRKKDIRLINYHQSSISKIINKYLEEREPLMMEVDSAEEKPNL